MSDIANEPYTRFIIEMGGVYTPGYLREFDAMLAALPADVKASADVIRYPGPYNGYYVVELTPHPDLSRVTTFPKLLEAMTLLPGANHGGIARILQKLRDEKAAMDAAIPSQPAQVVPADAVAEAPEDIEQRIIELYSNRKIPIDEVAEGAFISRAKLYRLLPALVEQGKLEYRESHKSLKRVSRLKK